MPTGQQTFFILDPVTGLVRYEFKGRIRAKGLTIESALPGASTADNDISFVIPDTNVQIGVVQSSYLGDGRGELTLYGKNWLLNRFAQIQLLSDAVGQYVYAYAYTKFVKIIDQDGKSNFWQKDQNDGRQVIRVGRVPFTMINSPGAAVTFNLAIPFSTEHYGTVVCVYPGTHWDFTIRGAVPNGLGQITMVIACTGPTHDCTVQYVSFGT